MAKADLTAQRLRELLDYEPSSGEFTRTIRSGRISAGTRAGYTNPSGYRVIRVDACAYYAHRLAWLYIFERWPRQDIDHIDGNRSNNAAWNLREVTREVNCQNLHKGNGLSPYLGVSKASHYGWRAVITTAGKQQHLGTFNTDQEAHRAYLATKQVLHPDAHISKDAQEAPERRQRSLKTKCFESLVARLSRDGFAYTK